MLLIVYDIQNDRLRAKFAKFLTQFGRRVQFSVFEIQNSDRVLRNIETEVNARYKKRFGQGDSVLVYDIDDKACVKRFGHAVNEESDLLIG